MSGLIASFGLIFLVGHQEGTTGIASFDTSGSGFTGNPAGPWVRMYHRDKYARDRVMKSARLLLPYIKDGDTILDVGCFTQEARRYYPKDVKYIGLDQRAYHPQTQVIDLNHGFSPVPCSHALCLETLEHLLDPEDTLQAIFDSLPADGRLVVSLPNEATLFHRLRGLLGVVDGNCFAGQGKHLHLPSLKQCRTLLSKLYCIEVEKYYISPSACNSSQAWVGAVLSLIPDRIHQILADSIPSLFARGFIFLLRKPSPASEPSPTPLPSDKDSTSPSSS